MVRPCTDQYTGKNRDLQRITVPYANVLGVMAEHEADGDEMIT